MTRVLPSILFWYNNGDDFIVLGMVWFSIIWGSRVLTWYECYVLQNHVSYYHVELIMKLLNEPASAAWYRALAAHSCQLSPAVAAATRGEGEFKFSPAQCWLQSSRTSTSHQCTVGLAPVRLPEPVHLRTVTAWDPGTSVVPSNWSVWFQQP